MLKFLTDCTITAQPLQVSLLGTAGDSVCMHSGVRVLATVCLL